MLFRQFHCYLFLSLIAFLTSVLFSCTASSPNFTGTITVGIVSYETGNQSINDYQNFKEYLAEQTGTFVELEPSFSELQALEQIKRQAWSVVFAPPGLAAIATQEQQYTPLFPIDTINDNAVIIVKENSSIRILMDLNNKIIGLGQPGSLTGYYLPLYDLYGLTLAEIKFSPTPKTLLTQLAESKIDAAALSENQFLEYGQQFPSIKFRILHKSRPIPPGSLLVSPTLNPQQQQKIQIILQQAPPNIIQQVGYIPRAKVPNYQQLIEFIEKVRPLEGKLQEKPVSLTSD